MTHAHRPVLAAIAAAALLAACSKSPDPAATNSASPAATTAVTPSTTAATPSTAAVTPTGAAPDHSTKAGAGQDDAGIAWKNAATDAEVDAAFALAKSEGKPVFVYWGAKWCPPCNQVKATLFNRQDFIERSRAFVPVYVDGDSPGAQKIGSRFKVSGYPTMVLFNPQGVEMTRLPGEVDAARYTEVLTLGMNAQRPVKDVLAQAKAGGRGLSPSDWRLLAFYSWGTDQELVPKDAVPGVLKQLADACPADQTEVATRLRLKAFAAVDTEKTKPTATAADQAKLLKLLGDENASRAHMDVISNYGTEIVRAVSTQGTPQRAEIVKAMDVALKRFEADTTLSRADRMGALIAQVDLAKIDADKNDLKAVPPKFPKLPDALLADVREQAAKADREITNGYERQAVITAAAYLLDQAGLGDESDSLLKANLAKSHSPYYLMSELASNAKSRGDKPEALRWYEEAFNKSEGPATRLQWGSSYVNALVEMAPQDEARIEKAVAQLFTEAAAAPDAFYERSGRSLQRIGTKLQAWNKGGQHSAAIGRLQKQLDGVCGALDKGDTKRAACEGLLKAPAKKSA